MKICRICRLEKDLSAFSKFPRAADGLEYRCKACIKIRNERCQIRNVERNGGKNPYAGQRFKKCSGPCKRTIAADNFHRNRRTGDGLEAICKDCSQKKHKVSWKKHKYGLTAEDYANKLKQQSGVCAICKNPETWKTRGGAVPDLSVDHDHRCCPGQKSCGKCIRDLLCARCNHILGHANDNIELLMLAITYLKRHLNG